MNGKIRIQRRAGALSHEPKWYQVFLDDMEITRFVRSIDVSFRFDGLPKVKLELIGIVELPDEIEAAISVYRHEEAQ